MATKKPAAKKPAAKKPVAKKTAAKKTAALVNPFLPEVTSDDFKKSILKHLHSTLGTDENKANERAWWNATAAAANELIFERLRQTQKTHYKEDTRAIHYFSAEFLMGRLMSNNLHNLQVFGAAKQALAELGHDIDTVCNEEDDMALGNGGLGRLAACFIDSLATLGMPALGYGIHYEHGLFRQEFQDGRQIERPDSWREYGSPWEICRPESTQEIPVYGYVETVIEADGNMKKVWHPGQVIKAVPWDVPIVGYAGGTVNILRLWESRASDFFDWDAFNSGAYQDAQREQNMAETVSKVLYPNDETEAGKELRLMQQYFFSAASLKDMLRRYKRRHGTDFGKFAALNVVQLNDTHPAIAIPELMRLLVDEEGLTWDNAWTICRETFCYTNHTLLPEALEKWPVYLIERVLPRHLEIIYEINRRFLAEEVEAKWPGNDDIKAKLSIIGEGDVRMVRMANLSVVGSYRVNGVAEVHSGLVKKDLFPEFDALYPGKLTNVTNGITPRRWLLACNEGLAELLTDTVGPEWPVKLDQLKGIEKFADDKKFQKRFMDVKKQTKVKLAKVIFDETGIEVSTDAIFDIQIKRLHAYKRQQLNLLHMMALYRRILENPNYDMHPRVFIFGSKAAPGYKLAKEIIYAINKVAEKVNNDPRVGDKMKIVFLPNYRVTLAEVMYPAADVSEQISQAGMEASGTGNMKFALNGALTLGTLDGANIEIAEEVGEENCAIFGLTVEEVQALAAKGYNPYDYYYSNPELKAVIDWFDTDYFTPGRPGELSAVKRHLLDEGDQYMALVDFQSYSDAQQRVDAMYRDQSDWARRMIINTANMGKFTSDRSIQDYVNNIWQLEKCDVPAAEEHF